MVVVSADNAEYVRYTYPYCELIALVALLIARYFIPLRLHQVKESPLCLDAEMLTADRSLTY